MAPASTGILQMPMELILRTTHTNLDVIDEQMRIHYVDPVWEKRYGAYRGKSCFEYFQGRSSPCPDCNVLEAFSKRQIVVREEILSQENNRCVQVTTAPFRDETGVWLAAEVYVDISERKRIEEELRTARADLEVRVAERTQELSRANGLLAAELQERQRNERELRKLTRAIIQSPSMVMITDTDGLIEFVNPRFCEVTGYAAHEVMGRAAGILKSGEMPPQVYGHLWETIKSGGEWRGEFHNRKKDGTLFWELASISAIRSPQGELERYVKVAEDITERKRLERMKDEFVSTVSHELRTPLSITKEGISLVIDGITGPLGDQQRHILGIARTNIDRLGRIINELLDIAKIEAGKVELKRATLDLGRLINEVAAPFQRTFQERKLQLHVDPGQEPLWCFADADRITQVLTNLLNNAMKFTPSGTVEIRARASEAEVLISVRDTGIGIAPENLPKLFGKFVQFNRDAYAGERGTGLGLAIVKGIVQMHGGTIWAESAVGQGSTFFFTLPRTAEDLGVGQRAGG